MADFYAIIMAAGQGRRCQQDRPKQYISIHHQPMLYYSTRAFIDAQCFRRILIITACDDQYYTQQNWSWKNNKTVVHCPIGGPERQDSLCAAVRYCQHFCNNNDWLLIHDAARPLIQTRDIEDFIKQAAHEPTGAILATPICDTLKKVHADMTIEHTEDRTQYWCAQTPQMFRFGHLITACKKKQNSMYTDASSLIEATQGKHLAPIRTILGPRYNRKVTYPEDLDVVNWIIQRRLYS